MKIITARCDMHGCNNIVHEWLYKHGDVLDNQDFCKACLRRKDGVR